MIKVLLKKTCLSLITFTMLLSSASTLVSAEGKEYISDVILSYGDTDSEAISWLTDNGYEYVDNNLNEGAEDNKFISMGKSKKRSVYLGYKTTTDASKAITDMKLMNMEGDYSTQDYQTLLDEEKENIQTFLKDFKATVKEYRENYTNTSGDTNAHKRAVAAHDLLNMYYDDDTDQCLGDLLLNPTKEECENYDSMSESEKKNHADMTTILMQGDSTIVLSIEQTLATATDTRNTLWIERYKTATDYDTMLEDLIFKEGMTQIEAANYLDKKYNDTAVMIACLANDFKAWVDNYVKGDAHLTDSAEDIEKYLKSSNMDETERLIWYTKGYQYEYLKNVTNGDESLLDLLMEDYTDTDGDFTQLYPIASVLTGGQKASLQFLSAYQFIALGYSDGEIVQDVVESANIENDKKAISIYNGIDRSIYTGNVALTKEAENLQTSSEDINYLDNWTSGRATYTTVILGLATAVSIATAVSTLIEGSECTSKLANCSQSIDKCRKELKKFEPYYSEYDVDDPVIVNLGDNESPLFVEMTDDQITDKVDNLRDELENLTSKNESLACWRKTFYACGIGFTIASIILSASTIYSAYKDLCDYYDVDFTAIPGYMVDEIIFDKTTKDFAYYKAVKCNRNSNDKFKTKNSELLGDYGDINGDVGKQWVALYTTKEKKCGYPITTNFTVQYNNTKIPEGYTVLTLFDENTAQNLTNEKAGYTYANKKKGIYMFYETDKNAYTTSSALTYGYIATALGVVVVIGVITYLKKKKKKLEE